MHNVGLSGDRGVIYVTQEDVDPRQTEDVVVVSDVSGEILAERPPWSQVGLKRSGHVVVRLDRQRMLLKFDAHIDGNALDRLMRQRHRIAIIEQRSDGGVKQYTAGYYNASATVVGAEFSTENDYWSITIDVHHVEAETLSQANR